MKVVVTGGSGLVGQALKTLIDLNNLDNFTFFSSADYDLRNSIEVDTMFIKYQPDIIIHCASIVAGLYGNIDSNYTMLVDNLKINMNIVDSCKKYKVRRLINILSTCVFGNDLDYPLTSEQIHQKIPDTSNEGYSYSKRILSTASKLLTRCSDIEVVNLIPTNLYGKYDNFHLHNSHVIPGLIHKIHLAKENNSELIVKGDGGAIRQFVYADDFARIILFFVNCKLQNKFNSVIVGPSVQDEISIKQLVNKLVHIFDFSGKVIYNSNYSNGQLKKTVSNNELLQFIPSFEFTTLEKGLTDTIDYFTTNYDNIRT